MHKQSETDRKQQKKIIMEMLYIQITNRRLRFLAKFFTCCIKKWSKAQIVLDISRCSLTNQNTDTLELQLIK